LIGLHGLPAHTIPGGISLTTTDLAPITAFGPMVTPGATNASAAIHAPRPTTMGPVTRGISGRV
jgi:hypothetical protein